MRIPSAIIAFILILTMAVPAMAQSDQPDYQLKPTVQNLFDNHVAWSDYTDELDNEMFDGDNDLTVDLIGESLSATLNYIQFINEQPLPSNNCQWDLWLAVEAIAADYAHMYSAMYFQLTASVGEPTDWEYWIENATSNEEYQIGSVPAKCWNKLDA